MWPLCFGVYFYYKSLLSLHKYTIHLKIKYSYFVLFVLVDGSDEDEVSQFSVRPDEALL